MLSTAVQPAQVSMVQMKSSTLTAWLVLALGFLDHLPSCLLHRVVDEMVDKKGWIGNPTYFLIPQWGSRTPRGPPCRYDSFEFG